MRHSQLQKQFKQIIHTTHIDKRIFLNWPLRAFIIHSFPIDSFGTDSTTYISYFVFEFTHYMKFILFCLLNKRFYCRSKWFCETYCDYKFNEVRTSEAVASSSPSINIVAEQRIERNINSIFLGICVACVRPNMSSDTAKSVSYSFWILNNYCVLIFCDSNAFNHKS